MSRPMPPCRECSRRRPGCHDAATCPAWGQYYTELEMFNARHRERLRLENIMTEYDISRRKRQDRRDNRRSEHAK